MPPFLASLGGELAGLLNLLFPPACSLCASELAERSRAEFFCPACLAGIRPLESPRCPVCALPYPTENGTDHLCQACNLHPPDYDGVCAAGLYRNSLREAIHRFKFRGGFNLDRALARLLIESLEREKPGYRPDLIVPVPLHPKRLRQRSYNQALLLAMQVGRHWQRPVTARLLLRQLPTASQQGLSADARRRNLRGAFRLDEQIEGLRVLLVDDVLTTGATAHECSRMLRSAGASEVFVAVLGRAPRNDIFT